VSAEPERSARPLPLTTSGASGADATTPPACTWRWRPTLSRRSGAGSWFTEHHQGAPGLAHGGVISAAVDEGMGYLLWLVESPAVTAHLEVDFRRPVPVGSRLELQARLEGVTGRKIRASLTGWVDGEVVVEARALYLKVGVEHFVPHAQRMGADMATRPYNP
jgi:acyl-coenzyme A thioesterase PaaI-like protein